MADTVTPWEALNGLQAESVRKLALNLMAVGVDGNGEIEQLSDGSYKRSWGSTGYKVGRELLNWCDYKDAIKKKEVKKGKKKKDPHSDMSRRLLSHLQEHYQALFEKTPNINFGRDIKLLNNLIKTDPNRSEESLRDYLTYWLECGATKHPVTQIDAWTQQNIFGNGDIRTFIKKLQKIDVEMAKRIPKDTPKSELPWAIRKKLESEEVVA